MTNTNHPVSRRTMLKGVGTALALPWLESLAPVATAAGASSSSIARAAFFYVPNGVIVPDWKPAKAGTDFELPYILQPLEPFRKYLNVLTNLELDKAKPNGDGPGDHARAMAAFLTGRQPRKTHGADIRLGQSADQLIASQIGDRTKFASLEFGIEKGLNAGNCDSGYSCAYSANLSWRGESTPNAKEVDPKAMFDRLFGNADPREKSAARAKREAYQKSVLDFVMEDTKSLTNQLSGADVRKLDEYLTAVREIEQRIERSRTQANRKVTLPNGVAAPQSGIPKDVREHMRLMIDLAVLAYQTDVTRVITFPLANDGSNKAYSVIGVGEGHHELSHHQNDKNKQEKLRKINRLHVEQFAYFLGKLAAAKEGEQSLLDQMMVVYGSGISDGNRHNHDDLPILFAGGGGGIKGGRHIVYPEKTPLMNLYMAMFERLGCGVKSFGDSTGVLEI